MGVIRRAWLKCSLTPGERRRRPARGASALTIVPGALLVLCRARPRPGLPDGLLESPEQGLLDVDRRDLWPRRRFPEDRLALDPLRLRGARGHHAASWAATPSLCGTAGPPR